MELSKGIQVADLRMNSVQVNGCRSVTHRAPKGETANGSKLADGRPGPSWRSRQPELSRLRLGGLVCLGRIDQTMDLWKLLADIVVLLIACLLGGGIAAKLKQSPLVGYLVGGMLVGGHGGLGIISAQKEIEAIAELGVALLLFSIGLEFSIDRLKALGSRPLIGGVVQVVATLALVITSCCWFQM